MATSVQRISHFARRCHITSLRQCHYHYQHHPQASSARAANNLHPQNQKQPSRRTFTSTSRTSAVPTDNHDDNASIRSDPTKRQHVYRESMHADGKTKHERELIEHLNDEEREMYEALTEAEREALGAVDWNRQSDMTRDRDRDRDWDLEKYIEFENEESRAELRAGMRDAERQWKANVSKSLAEQDLDQDEGPTEEQERIPPGFFNMNEPEDKYGDEEEEGDITSLAHLELDKHRELREYARLAAWEMPLLSKLVTPFTPPDRTRPLRFRYTTYLGEQHPAASKVVVDFAPAQLPELSGIQLEKLIKLAGARYNPSSGIVRMSCESFPSQAQNKRYLADRVSALLAEARDESDTFADVPFDFRYHRRKVFHEFPMRWALTPERKAELEAKRLRQRHLAGEREKAGLLMDGTEVIRKNLANAPRLEAETAPLMASVARQRQRQIGRQR